MGEFSLTHIVIVAVIFLVFFGPKRLPQLGSSIGEAIRGFKNAMNNDNGVSGVINTDAQPQQPNQHPQQAQQMPPQYPNQGQQQPYNQNYNNQPYNQALRDAPAQHTTDVHDAQPAQYTTEDKNRNGHS